MEYKYATDIRYEAEENYEPPYVGLNQALSWLDLEELKQLKADLTEEMMSKLKALPKPHKRDWNGKGWILDYDKMKPVEAILYVRRALYKYQVDEIMDHYNRLGKRITMFIRNLEFPEEVKEGHVTDMQIERAREYPITEVIDRKVRGGMVNCCFHDDVNASMSLRRHNRYKCFGCGAKGDVINLYMKIHNVDFKTAVNALSPA